MGYYGVFLGLHYKNDLAMSKAMDSDIYDRSNTLTIKLPVSIPYMSDQSDFNRVTGRIEHNGELFRLVKQKYAKDTLTLVCIRDTEHKKIDLALTDYVKTFADNPSNSNPTSKITVSFIKEYLPISFEINSATAGWTLQLAYQSHNRSLTSTFSASIVHPPEAA